MNLIQVLEQIAEDNNRFYRSSAPQVYHTAHVDNVYTHSELLATDWEIESERVNITREQLQTVLSEQASIEDIGSIWEYLEGVSI